MPQPIAPAPPPAGRTAAVDPAPDAAVTAAVRELLDETTELVCAADAEGRITYANRAWCDTLAYTLDDAIGRRAVDFVADEDRARYIETARRLYVGERVENFEAVLVARDGRRVVCRGRAVSEMVPDALAPNGLRCVATRAAYRDVTAERAADAWRSRLVAMLDSSADFIGTATPDGRIDYINRAGRRLLGLADDADLSSLRADSFHPPETLARLEAEAFPTVLREGRWTGDGLLRDVHGNDIPVSIGIVVSPSLVPGEPPFFTATMRDLRDRVRAEEALRASEAHYRSAIEGSLDAFLALRCVRDADGEIVDFEFSEVSTRGAALLGREKSELLGEKFCEVFPHARASGFFDRYAQVVRDRQPLEFESEPRDPRVIARAVRVQVVPLADGIALSLRDVTERVEADAERARLLAILEATPDAVVQRTLDGRVLFVNAAAQRMLDLGVGDVVRPHGDKTIYPDHARERLNDEAIPAALRDGVWSGELAVVQRDGAEMPVSQVIIAHRDANGDVARLSAVMRDISARTAAERALRENEARLSLIYNATSDLMFLMTVRDDGATREYRCASVNDAYLAVTGLAEEQVVGRLLEEVLPKDAAAHARAQYDAAVESGDVQRYIEHVALPTRMLVVETTLTPVTDAAGRCTHVLGAARDVTERLRAEAALRESEERFRDLVNQVSDYAIFRLDALGRVESWNRGAERLKGYAESEIVGCHISTFYPPESLAADIPGTLLDRAARLGRAEDEGWRLRKNGSRFWAHVVLTALRGDDGALLGYAKVTHDRTTRHQADVRLAESEARARGVLEASLDALFVLGPAKEYDAERPEFVIVECNREGARFAGRPHERLLGRSASAVFRQARRRGLLSACARVVATGDPYTTEYEISQSNESPRWAWLQIVRVGDGVAVTARDISAQKASERSLRTMALVDELTGVFNRRGFLSAAERQWQRAIRERQDVLLAYIDLNDFKRINDTYGHAEGDHALAAVGEVLRATFRGADVIGRIGGDEFAVLVVPTSNTGVPGAGHAPLDADTIEAMIRDRLAHHLGASNAAALAEGRPYAISLSLGVARAHPSTPTPDAPGSVAALMASADEQLYEEKRRRQSKAPARSRRD